MTSLKPVAITDSIDFIDLQAQQDRIRGNLEKALLKVLDHGKYIMGPEVKELELQLSKFCGTKHTVSCSNGTDAIVLALMALGVKPGDVVIIPTFTFIATAEAVAFLGAVPFMVDVTPDTFNICPDSLKTAIKQAKAVGIIAVDLFGQAADYDAINAIAAENGLWVIGDAAQSFGGSYKGAKIGNLTNVTCTSFFPAKPLGCYGDGGAVMANDDNIKAIMESCRIHGQGSHKYENVRLGMNGRLDTMQAAILLEKLKIFEDEIQLRQVVANRYSEGLRDHVEVPFIAQGNVSTWAQYTIKVSNRAKVCEALATLNVPTAIYYPILVHQQKAYNMYPVVSTGTPVSEDLSNQVMSLPMHPYLAEAKQDYIIQSVIQAVK